MNDYLRTIRLGYGKGEPHKQACWMTALSSHIGGEWTDKCECVDPTINHVCIWINDQYGSGPEADAARTEDIMEFGLFAPLGTLGTPEETERRLYHCLDVAVRRLLPAVCRGYSGMEKHAVALESLGQIKDRDSARAARAARAALDARAARDALAALAARAALDALAARAARAALAARAARDARAALAARAALDALDARDELDALAALAALAALDARAERRQVLKQYAYPLLRELIDMGPKAPTESVFEPACGVSEFLSLVGAP